MERIIRKLKEFDCVQGAVIESIAKLEMELDNVCAQHNLKTLFRQGRASIIPKKAQAAPDAHIFTPDLEPSLQIPPILGLGSPKVPQFVRKFHEELRSMVPELQKILKGQGKDFCFSSRVLARGKNLQEGCNVLQVQVQDEGDGLYTVRFSVGASFKSPVYKSYVQVKKNLGPMQQACECKNG